MKPKRSLASSKTGAFFWSILFLIQENVSNCSQFEATLQLLQDFFSHSLKIRKNKSVTTSKPVICSKLRHFFFEDSIAFAMLRRKIKGQLHCMASGRHPLRSRTNVRQATSVPDGAR